ncbi:MAG: DUF2589 domain-containing protein [Bacteroidota bacterium]
MATTNEVFAAAEFQALPLEFIVSAPLLGVIKAQTVATQTTKDFIEQFKKDSIEFTVKTASESTGQSAATSTVETKINAPLLSMVPIPHIRIDSFTTSFKYEISQVQTIKKSTEGGGDVTIGAAGILSKFVDISLKGNVTSSKSSESVLNRSGSLDITLHASEAPMPEGLARILSLLSKTIPGQ